MEIIRKVSDMIEKCANEKKLGKTIVVVPTMGYLHDGHLSLINKAKELGDFVITTLFVNPTQFGPNEDFARYPRDEKRDEELCSKAGSDILFIPEINDIYPENYKTYVTVEDLSKKLCGETRTGHFRGVTTICTKLFNITKADYGVFGWKDAQQLLILKRMVKDLNMSINLVGMPIVREADGLAMSSRNTYLSPEERKQALIINQALKKGEEMIKANPNISLTKVLDVILVMIRSVPLANVDYVEIVSQETLDPIDIYQPDNTLIAAAVFFGKTRLIDNVRL